MWWCCCGDAADDGVAIVSGGDNSNIAFTANLYKIDATLGKSNFLLYINTILNFVG